MFIKVSSNRPGVFSFHVGDSQGEPEGCGFNSERDFYLIKGVSQFYPTFSAAHTAASRIASFLPSAIRAKKLQYVKKSEQDRSIVSDPLPVEADIFGYYAEQVRLLKERFGDILGSDEARKVAPTKTDRHEYQIGVDALSQEITETIKSMDAFTQDLEDRHDIHTMESMKHELKTLLQQVGGPEEDSLSDDSGIKTAETDAGIAPNTIRSVFEYSAKICEAMSHLGKIRIGKAFATDAGFSIPFVDHEDGQEIAIAEIDDDLMFRTIRPCNKLAARMPYNSTAFYQNVFEPVINAVGHVMHNRIWVNVGGGGSSRFVMSGVNVDKNQRVSVKVVFSNGEWGLVSGPPRPSLMAIEKLAQATPQVADVGHQQFGIGTQVKCTNPKLKSYFNRTGMVVATNPKTDFIDVSVDFGRGLGLAVLTDSDITST